MSHLAADLRDAVRALRHHPTFTLAAVLTIALGIGANTAVFSVVHAVLLRPLPYRAPDRLVWMAKFEPAMRAEIASGADYLDWRDQARTLDAVAAWGEAPALTLTAPGEPERVLGAHVTAGFLPLLGVSPMRGRNFTADEERLNGVPVAVVSHRLWQRLAGPGAAFAERPLRLDIGVLTIVGVLPPGFVFPQSPAPDVLLPLRLNEATERQRQMMSIVHVIARLRPSATPELARAEATEIWRRSEGRAAAQRPPVPFGNEGALVPPPPGSGNHFEIRVEEPAGPGQADPARRPAGPAGSVIVRSLHDHLVGDVRPALMLLTTTVALVLLIACANVANLVLARATARSRELAVRATLGATRWRLVRQLLVENLVLSLAGGAIALVVAVWSLSALHAYLPAALTDAAPGGLAIGMNGSVLAFTLLVAAATSILFGVGPALVASRVDVDAALKEASRLAAGSTSRTRLRRALVVVEIAMAVVLLTGAGLLVRSFSRLLALDPGFRPERVVTMALNLERPGDETAASRAAALFDEVAGRVRALPSVQAVAFGDTVPMREYSRVMMGLSLEGRDQGLSSGPPPDVAISMVSPEYFAAMGMRVLRGRAFTGQDRTGAPPVAIVNERLAREFWGGENPIGRRFRFGPRRPDWITVVGVVADVRHDELAAEPRRTMYQPFAQESTPFGFIVVRTTGEPAAIVQSARQVVRSIDPSLALYDVATMEQRLERSVAGRRFNMLLIVLFACVALALAAVGLYGLLAYLVGERTREIGIRMALGARASDVMRLVLRQGAFMVTFGIALGLAGALGSGPLLSSALYAVTPRDAMTLGTVPLLIAAVAGLAIWLPARRATRVDPVEALREE
jgi:putative ABC transport system permease protein